MFEDTLKREIFLNNAYCEMEADFQEILNDEERIVNMNEKVRELFGFIIELLAKGNVSQISYEGHYKFKEVFAHHYCHKMLEATEQVLSQFIDTEMIALIDTTGQAVHYLLKAQVVETEYYIDSYGIFCDLKDVAKRYVNNQIDQVRTFKYDDESIFAISFNDRLNDIRDFSSDYIDDIDDLELQEDYFENLNLAIIFKYLTNLNQNIRILEVENTLFEPELSINPLYIQP